jgi:hypothetical protein
VTGNKNSMPEFSEYKFDRYEGRELDKELDEEEGLDNISSEEQAGDLRNAYDEISDKTPADFKETFEEIIGSVELHFDSNNPEWNEDVIEPLNEVMDEISMADSDELMEREDEFADRIAAIQKACQNLSKKKVH